MTKGGEEGKRGGLLEDGCDNGFSSEVPRKPMKKVSILAHKMDHIREIEAPSVGQQSIASFKCFKISRRDSFS